MNNKQSAFIAFSAIITLISLFVAVSQQSLLFLVYGIPILFGFGIILCSLGSVALFLYIYKTLKDLDDNIDLDDYEITRVDEPK
jgi:hypothetical protein